MKCGVKVALAAGACYVLGRRKVRLATMLALGAAAAGGGGKLGPAEDEEEKEEAPADEVGALEEEQEPAPRRRRPARSPVTRGQTR